MPDVEAVNGIISTFDLWIKYNWRLSIPEGQQQLAAHSAEGARRVRDREQVDEAKVRGTTASATGLDGKDVAVVAGEPSSNMVAVHEVRNRFFPPCL